MEVDYSNPYIDKTQIRFIYCSICNKLVEINKLHYCNDTIMVTA